MWHHAVQFRHHVDSYILIAGADWWRERGYRAGYELVPGDQARRIVRTVFARDPLFAQRVRGLRQDARGFGGRPAKSLEDLLRALGGQLRPESAELLLLRCKSERVGHEVVRPSNLIEPAAAEAVATRAPSVTFWIEIAMVGEDDQPLPGLVFEVLLPDGTKRTGKLDGDGWARLEPVPQGTCQVCFPELDREAWTPAQTA